MVTGLGVISALGHDAAAFAAALFAGAGGIGPITRIPTDGLGVRVAAEVRDFDPAAHFAKNRVGLLDRFAQFAMVAARQAIAQSAPPFDQGLGARTATLIGTGVGGLGTQDDNFRKIYAENAKRVHPFIIPRVMASAAASHIGKCAGRCGRAGTGGHDSRHRPRSRAADDQLRDARSGLRPRLCAEPGARGADRRGAHQLVRVRWAQRRARRPPLRLNARPFLVTPDMI